jgi:O-antigen/teichoic acid export membrane protein
MKNKNSLRDYMVFASAAMFFLYGGAKLFGYMFHLGFVWFFDQESYGRFVYLWSLALFVAGMMPNISLAVGRHIPYLLGAAKIKEAQKAKNTGWTLSILVAVLASLVLASLYMVGLLPDIYDMQSIIFVFFICVSTLLSNTLSQVISGYRRPEISSAFNLILNILRLLGLSCAFLLLSTLEGVLFYVGLAYVSFLVLIFAYVRINYGISPGFDLRYARELFSFGSYSLFYETANNMLSWTDIFIINIILGSSTVAVYNVVWLSSTAYLILFLPILTVFRPVISGLLGAKNIMGARYLTSYLFESFFLIFSPALIFILAYPTELLSSFVGVAYGSGGDPLKILIVASFFSGLSQLFLSLISSSGSPQLNAKILVSAALINLALNLVAIPVYGMVGAAYATLASSIFIYLVSKYKANKIIAFEYLHWRVFKMVFSASLVYILWFLSDFPADSISKLLINFVFITFSYLVLVFCMRSFRQEDAEIASGFLERFGFRKKSRDRILKMFMYGVGYSNTLR